ncbi:uncharacterized protein MELLADRAFT_109689 [Melampsora larici-populina 98AG31]|uniref:Uncharacterized protein n=1 Tax=Melampsora larici-populina (strain 98AG31 / pathotype 3-4-7) TaxID=747676 RepID=F4RXA9_MELLP|nr:uncharacterized protein MELLADRAFT_109689 [Melampsora larici-populina 98AG31]EGG03019.1 hypothetical protein MELLADRAFT_109689 [Melampsora larici-populina 98AG31]
MTVQVKFKIHTEKEVKVDQGNSMKVATQGRKGAATSMVRHNLVESKMFNQGNILELVKCLFGKSLHNFKGMCGDICEEYKPGMHHLVLSSPIAPCLIWMGQVGSEKITLVDSLTWQAFVDLLSKATKHKGLVIIFTENKKEKAKKVAQNCAAKELIASASGTTAAEAQMGVLSKELEKSGMATRKIPPQTYEYLAIMKKSCVYHKATSVNDRVKMRSAQMQAKALPDEAKKIKIEPARGMHPALAAHLLSEAMEWANVLKGKVEALPDKDALESHLESNQISSSPEF